MKRGLATGVGRIVGREKQVKLQVVDKYRLSAKQWRRLSPPCAMGTPETPWEYERGHTQAHLTQGALVCLGTGRCKKVTRA